MLDTGSAPPLPPNMSPILRQNVRSRHTGTPTRRSIH
jgi:hypothetical protein